MGNRAIKTKLFIERYIQYDLFEPINVDFVMQIEGAVADFRTRVIS